MEGYRRNKYYLSKLLNSKEFFLIFIQEHWMPSYKSNSEFSSDFSSYEFQTTSSDTFLPPEDIILKTGPTWHGTAIGWHSSLSPNVQKLPIVSTRFCGLRLKICNIEIIAYTVYLPTAGQDDEFLEEISLLTHDINEHTNHDSTVIIGIDLNTSEKSTSRRKEAFSAFNSEFELKTILPGEEPTFHHNNGVSESQIDHILTNNTKIVSFLEHKCKLDDPTNLSSHDAILGKLKMYVDKDKDDTNNTHNYEDFKPNKIKWEENKEYQDMTARILGQLLKTYDEPEHLPDLAEMTSNMIALCGEKCFDVKVSHRRNTH